MSAPLLHLVKYRWRNAHDVPIGPEWTSVLASAGDDDVLRTVALGRGTVTGVEVLERVPIPEALRRTGRSSWARAMVVLYDRAARDYTAAEFLAAMERRVREVAA